MELTNGKTILAELAGIVISAEVLKIIDEPSQRLLLKKYKNGKKMNFNEETYD